VHCTPFTGIGIFNIHMIFINFSFYLFGLKNISYDHLVLFCDDTDVSYSRISVRGWELRDVLLFFKYTMNPLQ